MDEDFVANSTCDGDESSMESSGSDSDNNLDCEEDLVIMKEKNKLNSALEWFERQLYVN